MSALKSTAGVIAATIYKIIYGTIGATVTTTTAEAEKTLLQKLGLIKLISQSIGVAATETWLANDDAVLGPLAPQILSALNGGNLSSAIATVLTLLVQATV